MSNPNYDVQIARVCHEANRVLQAVNGEPVNLPWDWCTEDLQASAVIGVRVALAGATPEEQHESWCETKRSQGWVYGPTKDAVLKTHPNLVAYSELPEMQKRKDSVFIAVVEALKAAVTPLTTEEQDASSDTAQPA